MVLRTLPFEGKPAEAVAWLVARQKERPHVPILVERREGTAPILALMRRCWAQEAVARPSFAQFLPELEVTLTLSRTVTLTLTLASPSP